MWSPHPGGFMSKNLSGLWANTNRWIHFLKAESKRAVHAMVVKTDQHCRAIKCHDDVTPTYQCHHMQETYQGCGDECRVYAVRPTRWHDDSLYLVEQWLASYPFTHHAASPRTSTTQDPERFHWRHTIPYILPSLVLRFRKQKQGKRAPPGSLRNRLAFAGDPMSQSVHAVCCTEALEGCG